MLSFFTDAVLRAPTLGSMFVGCLAGIIGCFVFLQRRCLVGEALSHASYPGVVLSVVLMLAAYSTVGSGFVIALLIGAFIISLLGLFAIDFCEKRLSISSDASLCLVLSLFFGVGVLLASWLQSTHPLGYRLAQTYLFGQTATLVDRDIWIYGGLGLIAVLCIVICYRPLKIVHFDRTYAQSIGMPTKRVTAIVHLLLALAIVVGIRSVGVVLMSAMLIAPPVAARQWTNRMAPFLTLSACFGVFAGYVGNVLSYYVPVWIHQPSLALPTGPMISLIAVGVALFSLLFAPERGVLSRRLFHSKRHRACFITQEER